MNRFEFLKKGTLAGLGVAVMPALLAACKEETLVPDFDGKVLIVGAGAAGMMAGYYLAKQGIDFEIVEASGIYGGRVKRLEGFADFPIDLGAEWIHTSPGVFADLLDDKEQKGQIELIPYSPDTIHTWNNDRIHRHNWASYFYQEYKFKRSTWYDFFEDFVVPSIEEKIRFNQPITEIDYRGAKVLATASDGTVYEADKLMLTVPISMLQKGRIAFNPALPATKADALDTVDFPPGIKVFVEFSERFYPDMLFMGGLISGLVDSGALYYDAAFKKGSDRNVLGLFWVAPEANRFTDLPSGDKILEEVLKETGYDFMMERLRLPICNIAFRTGPLSLIFRDLTATSRNRIVAPLKHCGSHWMASCILPERRCG